MLELFHPDVKRKERKPCARKPLNRALQVKTTPRVFLGTLGGFMLILSFTNHYENITSHTTLANKSVLFMDQTRAELKP